MQVINLNEYRQNKGGSNLYKPTIEEVRTEDMTTNRYARLFIERCFLEGVDKQFLLAVFKEGIKVLENE